MTWPNTDQFDNASTHGAEVALKERENGAVEPQEAPLSGEWADGITKRDVAFNVGYTPEHTHMADSEYFEGEEELADAWEQGYFDAWAFSIA